MFLDEALNDMGGYPTLVIVSGDMFQTRIDLIDHHSALIEHVNYPSQDHIRIKTVCGTTICIKEEKSVHHFQQGPVLKHLLNRPNHFDSWYSGRENLDFRSQKVKEYLCL